jgi:3-oxoacyl-[acyl-carrier protein] reductase
MDNTETHSVIITGAAHGIGAAYADRLANDGWAVVIADLDGEGAEQKARELGKNGFKALAVRADISSEDDVRKMVGLTVKEFGGITGLVNNAAGFSVVPCHGHPSTRFRSVSGT